MAARMPRMTSTNSSSIKVNADWRLRWVRELAGIFDFITQLGGCSFNIILQGENRDDHADENRADERRDEKEQQGLGHGDGGLELAVEVALGDIGDADQFLIETSALF